MVIKGGQALVYSKATALFRRMDLRIKGNRIAELAPDLQPEAGEDVLDARGKLVLSGMVNAHYHSYSNFLKGTAWGEPLELWALDTVALGSRMDQRVMALSAKLGIAEMLRCGVTACLDHIPHLDKVDAIAAEYRQAGFRATIAPMIADISDDDILPGIKEKNFSAAGTRRTPEQFSALYDGWANRWHRPDEALRLMVGVNSPQRASMDALEMAAGIGKRLDIGIHAHVLETRWQVDAAQAQGEDVVEKMRMAGLLGKRTSLAHCVWLTKKQKDVLQAFGCTVVHNPTSNLLLGSGKADIVELLRRGVHVALGSDGSNCATGQNMLGVLRTALLLSRLDEPDYRQWIGPEEAYLLASAYGARAADWDGITGKLEPGMRADIVVAEDDGIAQTPCFDRLIQLLLLQDRIKATDVFIDGKCVMENARLLCLDEEALRSEAEQVHHMLFEDLKKIVFSPDEKKKIYSNVYTQRRVQ